MTEEAAGRGLPQEESFAEEFARAVRRGRSPEGFILGQKEELQQAIGKDGEVGLGDVVSTLLMYQQYGAISEGDVRPLVGQLGQQFGIDGLTEEQYFEEVVPDVQRQLEETQARERQEAERRAREDAEKYVANWGIQRLDEIALYYEDHRNELEGVENANWDSRLEKYKGGRDALAQELLTMKDPLARKTALQRANFFLIGLHPTESERIHHTEQTLGSHVYADRLFHLSRTALYPTLMGRSPDSTDASYQAGSIAVSVRMYRYDDPASVMAAQREAAFESLAFGAASPAETHTLGKPLIFPYQAFAPPRA